MTYLEELEDRIGYHFKDRELLLTAVTHTSYANEHRKKNCQHNERLEFLGDAVLELVSSEYLFHGHPEMGEGQLSKTRASLVCEPSLAKCAARMGIPKFLRLGNGEEQMGGRTKDSITADAVEAIIGAVFCDGGFEEARKVVRRHVLSDIRKEDLFSDKKSYLQELLQEHNHAVEYRLIDEKGPDHMKSFTVAAVIDGTVCGTGSGRTKKAAEQAAAEEAIKAMKAQGI
jgi:ribonuclease-3